MRSPGLAAVLWVLTVATAGTVSAQQPQTLLPHIYQTGSLGALVLNLSPLDDQTAVFGGLRGALIINRTLGVGGGAYGLISNLRTPVTDTTTARLFVYYGGAEFEYSLLPLRLMHPVASVLVGAGAARYGRDETVDERTSAFFVIEPAAHLALNVTAGFKIAAGASYRRTIGLDLTGFGDADLRGVSGVLTLRFQH